MIGNSHTSGRSYAQVKAIDVVWDPLIGPAS
jgi:hypothetical protein